MIKQAENLMKMVFKQLLHVYKQGAQESHIYLLNILLKEIMWHVHYAASTIQK